MRHFKMEAFVLGILAGMLFILAMIYASKAQAETKWYYDTERTGEGIILTELDNGGLALAYFTHVDEAISEPPIVSPPPPPAVYSMCNGGTLWLTGYSELLAEGVAIGTLYFDVAQDYPTAFNGSVSTSDDVGTFLIEADGDGFTLYLNTNNTLPNLSIFNRELKFTTVLAE